MFKVQTVAPTVGLPAMGVKILHYVGFPTRGRVDAWVVKASKINTGTKPKYPTKTRIILNFSILLGALPSIRQGLGYPEFFLPHSVGAPHDPHYRQA